MFYLIIAVLCMVSVSILLKVLRQRGIDIRQTIVAGYPVAFLLTWLLLKPDFNTIGELSSAWVIMLLLGMSLPLVFIILGRAIESVGIIATDAAQRLSLIIPIVAAFVLFGEALTSQRSLGIAIGFLALVALLYRQSEPLIATDKITTDKTATNNQATTTNMATPLTTAKPANSSKKVPVTVWLCQAPATC